MVEVPIVQMLAIPLQYEEACAKVNHCRQFWEDNTQLCTAAARIQYFAVAHAHGFQAPFNLAKLANRIEMLWEDDRRIAILLMKQYVPLGEIRLELARTSLCYYIARQMSDDLQNISQPWPSVDQELRIHHRELSRIHAEMERKGWLR